MRKENHLHLAELLLPPATKLLLEKKVTSINTQHIWHRALLEIKAEISNA